MIHNKYPVHIQIVHKVYMNLIFTLKTHDDIMINLPFNILYLGNKNLVY